MKLFSKQVKYIQEYDSSHHGKKANIPIGNMLELPIEIEQPKETKIFRCYDKDKKLLGEIRPHGAEKQYEIFL